MLRSLDAAIRNGHRDGTRIQHAFERTAGVSVNHLDVVDDRSSIIESLIQAERKSPSCYEPAKALFCRILEGDLTVGQALLQASQVADPVERKCATDIIRASKDFLVKQTPSHVSAFPAMSISIPNGMSLSVSPIWIRHRKNPRLMVLHFWQKPLTDWQLGAAGAVLRSALVQGQPEFARCELDFVSVSLAEFATRRQFKHYTWAKIRPLSEADLNRFWKQFCAAWSEYKRRKPRVIKRRRLPDMFATQ
jgi:hypothetical protein